MDERQKTLLKYLVTMTLVFIIERIANIRNGKNLLRLIIYTLIQIGLTYVCVGSIENIRKKELKR